MNELIKRLRDKSGGAIIENSFGIIIITLLLAVALAFMPVVDNIATADRVAQEVTRYVEIHGDAGYAQAEFERLSGIRKLRDSTMAINTSGRIQLDSEFTVTITYTPVIKIGVFASIPLTIYRKATGRSEKYWK